MAEFTINSSTSETTKFMLFELNYSYTPMLGRQLNINIKFCSVKQFALQVKWNLMATHNAIIANHIKQAHHVNRARQDTPEYNEGDLVYLSMKDLSLLKGRSSKLVLYYIG